MDDTGIHLFGHLHSGDGNHLAPSRSPRPFAYVWPISTWYGSTIKSNTVEIPTSVFGSVGTLDETQDWLTAQHPEIIAELRQTRRIRCGGSLFNVAPPARKLDRK